ncbi:hypothetical protein PJE062_5149 [Pseudovibrio sp. JE062]|nr:hypothetical protein PJE062_5149 [Pseudovibrio sp. JE062]
MLIAAQLNHTNKPPQRILCSHNKPKGYRSTQSMPYTQICYVLHANSDHDNPKTCKKCISVMRNYLFFYKLK